MTSQNKNRLDLAGVRVNNVVGKKLVSTDQDLNMRQRWCQVTKHHQDSGQDEGGQCPLISALIPCLPFHVQCGSGQQSPGRTVTHYQVTRVGKGLETLTPRVLSEHWELHKEFTKKWSIQRWQW